MLGKILSIAGSMLVLGGLTLGEGFHKVSNEQEKQIAYYKETVDYLNKKNDTLHARLDTVLQISKTLAAIAADTSDIWLRGYNQCKYDKACSFIFSDSVLTVSMHEGMCNYVLQKDIARLHHEKKTVTGSGKIQDTSIHLRRK